MESCKAKKEKKFQKRVEKYEAAEERAEMKQQIKEKKAEKAPIKVTKHPQVPIQPFLGTTKLLQGSMQADRKPDHEVKLSLLVEILFTVKDLLSLP